MRNYKMTIAYDGTRYQGWQRQSATDQTIQGILEKAISIIAGYDVTIDGSGRTDAGVHAKGQTANVKLAGKIEEKEFQAKINAILPEDIRICKTELVKNSFHSRYSARSKRYEYQIDQREKADVFTRKYCYHYIERLNIDDMKAAADILKGTHDFAAFTDKKDEKSTVRTIYDIEITKKNEKIYFDFYGDGFMYHMVRILTGTLLEIGRGTIKLNHVQKILRSKNRAESGFLAPASGLCLKEVYYK